MMIWMRLIFVVILFSSISTIRSLTRFKLKNQCESNREITLVIHEIWMDDKDYIKTLITNLKEACVNITLVKLMPYGVVNVNNLNPIDLSFYYFVGMEDREILYNLQMEKNVDVVIVTMHSYTINYLKQFPRHLKFTVSSDSESILNSKNLLDVIKNPQFDRFEFEKN